MFFIYILFKTSFLFIVSTLIFDMFYVCVKIHCVKIHIFIYLCIIYVKKRTDFLSLHNKL